MLSKRAYYFVKPFLPGKVRLALRRARAKSILNSCSNVWPILPGSGEAPAGWRGWPAGKQFPVLLTHDVEGTRGLNRCRQLAEIEMEHGFRSSFNFIPNGEYVVPQDLVTWLQSNGFEVGVHDLRHDGTLFHSRQAFKKDAIAINHQLKTWDAAGFRAGFMLHKLDWLHALEIEYDSSTFDVDPFEPQPDGAQTIFPFWVPKPDPEADVLKQTDQTAEQSQRTSKPLNSSLSALRSTSGYIELPYTLVQDYNLFVVLQQRNIEIWTKKLRWIDEKKGMAMLDTHPDYMAMPGEQPSAYEFPVQYYRDFLDHIRQEYAGRYWSALPKEIAAYCRPFQPKQARPPRRVIMLTYSFYNSDNRVRRYAETLSRRGDHVRVYCLGDDDQVRDGTWETLNGVQIKRLQSRVKNESGKLSYAWRQSRFFFKALATLSPANNPDGCDLLHIHNIPDFLVFAGIRLKLRHTAIILDIHDIVPELYESKFKPGHTSPVASFLRLLEKWSCRFADHVIIANHIWKKTILSRSAPSTKVTALVNNVDLDLFTPQKRSRLDDGRLVLLYPGSLNYHQGLDIAINAVAKLVGEFPKLELHIYGSGSSLPELKMLTKNLGLEKNVLFFDSVQIDKIPALMANADIGIVPKRAEGFGDQAYSTKIMEFMSQRLPVILSRTTIDSLYFTDSHAAFFNSGDADDCARVIRRVIADPAYRATLASNGFAYAQANSWETMKDVYLNIVDRLTMTSVSVRS